MEMQVIWNAISIWNAIALIMMSLQWKRPLEPYPQVAMKFW